MGPACFSAISVGLFLSLECMVFIAAAWDKKRKNATLRVQGPKKSGFRAEIPLIMSYLGPKAL